MELGQSGRWLSIISTLSGKGSSSETWKATVRSGSSSRSSGLGRGGKNGAKHRHDDGFRFGSKKFLAEREIFYSVVFTRKLVYQGGIKD